MDKTHDGLVVVPFPEEILKCLLKFFSYAGCVLSKHSFLFLLVLICCGYANYNAQRAYYEYIIIYYEYIISDYASSSNSGVHTFKRGVTGPSNTSTIITFKSSLCQMYPYPYPWSVASLLEGSGAN